jgi:hypothetical protein
VLAARHMQGAELERSLSTVADGQLSAPACQQAAMNACTWYRAQKA